MEANLDRLESILFGFALFHAPVVLSFFSKQIILSQRLDWTVLGLRAWAIGRVAITGSCLDDF